MTEFLITRTRTVVERATLTRDDIIKILEGVDFGRRLSKASDGDLVATLIDLAASDLPEWADVSSALTLAAEGTDECIDVDDWELTEARP